MTVSKFIYNIAIHLILVISILFGVSQCNKSKEIKKSLESKEYVFNKANEIVDIILDSDSNKITKSKPHEEILSKEAVSNKHLIDSLSKELKLAKGESIQSVTRIPIKSEVSLKAKEVNNDYAYTENENWYSRYSFKDSVFDLKYKTEYNSIVTNKKNTFLGLDYSMPTRFHYDLVKDKDAEQITPTTIYFSNKPKPKVNIDVNNVNKYRSFDNGVLSGLEASIGVNRLNFGGQYLYNFNSNIDSKKEWELFVKYNLF